MLWKDPVRNKRHNTPHSDRYGILETQNAQTTIIYTKVSVVSYHPSNKENFHIFIKGLAKNTYTNM